MITLLNKYKAYSLGLYAFLLFLHFVIKDYFFPLSLVYYATPLILIILFGALTTLSFYKRKKIVYSLTFVLSLLIFYWFSNYFNLSTTTNNSKNQSLLFWNIAKNEAGLPLKIISKKINEFPINILTFVETDKVSTSDIENLKKKHSNYTFNTLKGNMLIGIQGKIESIAYTEKEKSVNFNYVVSKINDKKIALLIVDVYASPLYNKSEGLKTIIDFAKTHDVNFIVGDFNTPYKSIHFNNYKENYTSFRDYAEGFTATWPFGIPLLELDQIWIAKSIYATRLNKYNYSISDHQLLVAEYGFEQQE